MNLSLATGRAIPDLDGPISTARDEHTRVIVVPRYSVDGHVMGLVRVEERARVGLRADVQLALFRADEEHVVFLAMKVECGAATCTGVYAHVCVSQVCTWTL